MKDLGLMHYFLGLEVWQSLEGIFLNQGKYAVEILKRFNMSVLGPGIVHSSITYRHIFHPFSYHYCPFIIPFSIHLL